jgi:hypothetical protein
MYICFVTAPIFIGQFLKQTATIALLSTGFRNAVDLRKMCESLRKYAALFEISSTASVMAVISATQ